MVEMIFLAALLLFLGLAGWKIERDVDRKVRRIQKKVQGQGTPHQRAGGLLGGIKKAASLLAQERRQAKYHICIVPERNGKRND